jgi:hypothetical protein
MPAQAHSEFGDATTVIDGPTASSGYAAYSAMHALGAGGRGKRSESHVTKPSFSRTADYFSEERPFLVLIDKKGVVGALQELDAHLRSVSAVDP